MIAAKRSLAALAGCSLALAGAVFVPARARSTSASTRSHTGPVVAVNANQSNNWSGYNQGKIERSTAFHLELEAPRSRAETLDPDDPRRFRKSHRHSAG